MSDLRFEANLPTDAAMPVKPTRDINRTNLKRRVRIWLDAYLSPGETELVLLLGEETFDVTIARRAEPVVNESERDHDDPAVRQYDRAEYRAPVVDGHEPG